MTFAEKLEKCMTKRALSPSALARASGLSLGQVSRLLGGTREPSHKTVPMLAKALGVHPVELLRGTGHEDLAPVVLPSGAAASGEYVDDLVRALEERDAERSDREKAEADACRYRALLEAETAERERQVSRAQEDAQKAHVAHQADRQRFADLEIAIRLACDAGMGVPTLAAVKAMFEQLQAAQAKLAARAKR